MHHLRAPILLLEPSQQPLVQLRFPCACCRERLSVVFCYWISFWKGYLMYLRSWCCSSKLKNLGKLLLLQGRAGSSCRQVTSAGHPALPLLWWPSWLCRAVGQCHLSEYKGMGIWGCLAPAHLDVAETWTLSMNSYPPATKNLSGSWVICVLSMDKRGYLPA